MAKKGVALEQFEYSSEEFVFIAFSMLESKGYTGLVELMSLLEKPELIMKVIYLLGGMNIKMPTPKEFSKCLKASMQCYMDMVKKKTDTLPAGAADIKEYMHLSDEEHKELLDMFDDWVVYMHKNGYEIEDFIKINRNNTKRRVANIKKGKKWTSTKY